MRFLVKVAENEKFVNPICGQKHEERNWIKQGETITVKKYNKDKRDQI
jgi:translation initiation factor IF-1